MENEKQQCEERAGITLPWGGKLLNYCPIHANQLVAIANAIGSPIQAQILPSTSNIKCQQVHKLTDEEKEIAKTFTL